MKSLPSLVGLIAPLLLTTTLLTTTTLAATVEGKWPTPQDLETTPNNPQVATQNQSLNPITPPVNNTLPNPTQRPANNQVQKTQVKSNKVAAYMGLGIDILPEAIVAQMPVGISTGEGIIVTRFSNDSPAKKSGLLVHDILLSYDQIRIIHPKQFIDLVRKDQPGRVVQLKVLRNGKVINHPVTLGMQQVPQIPDGLMIKQLGKNLYQANIRFTDSNGKKQLHQYKGTREQIYYQALNARDLPDKDRQQLLYAAGGPNKNQSTNNWRSFFPFGNNSNSYNNNNSNSNKGSFGSFFPFNR